MRFPFSIAIAWLFLVGPASADLTVTVKDAAVIRTTTPTIVTQLTVDGQAFGDPVKTEGESVTESESPAKILLVASDVDLSKALVKLKCRTAAPKRADVGVFIVDEPGTHEIEVNVISEGPLRWDDELVTVTVGGPEPAPPEPPTPPEPPAPPVPDIPGDEFGNLGQRVAQWASGLPSLSDLAEVYEEHAELLLSDQSATSGSVSQSLVLAIAGMPYAASYVELRKLINDDLASRGVLARVPFAEYLSAIASGLKGAR